MYHSMYFQDDEGNTYNTWDNWFLVPSERPSIAPPSVNAPYDDFKDEFGGINLRLLDTNDVEYTSRSGSHTWIIDNEYGEHGNWYDIYSDVMLKLHGKKMKVWLEDEPDFYYYGRLIVANFKSEESYSTIEIQYLFEPYKYKMEPYTYSNYVEVPLSKNPIYPYIETDNIPSSWYDNFNAGFVQSSYDPNSYVPGTNYPATYAESYINITNHGKYDAPFILKIHPTFEYVPDPDYPDYKDAKYYYKYNGEEYELLASAPGLQKMYYRRLRLRNASVDKLTGSLKSIMVEDFNMDPWELTTDDLFQNENCRGTVFDGVNKETYRLWDSPNTNFEHVSNGKYNLYGPRNQDILDEEYTYPSTKIYSKPTMETTKSFYFPVRKPGTTSIGVGVPTGCFLNYATTFKNRPGTGEWDGNSISPYIKLRYDIEVRERYI